jgi:lipopolysaccharide transport system permease protein
MDSRLNVDREALPEVVYSPESQMRRPGQLLRSMAHDLRASRELAWRLFVRDFNAQYRQSALGYVWAVIPAIATTAIWVFLNDQNIINVAKPDVPYPLYVLLGTVLWATFRESLLNPLRQVSASKGMLSKINFPREALLLAGFGHVFVNLAINLVLLTVLFIWYRAPLQPLMLLAPFGILAIIAFGTMVGVMLVPLGVLYTDVGRALEVGLMFWFYLTPVVYPPPTSFPASILTKLNPVSPLIGTTRELMTTGQVSSPAGFGAVTGTTLVLLLLGWVIYRVAMPHMIERMQA